MSRQMEARPDHIEVRRAQWKRELPDIDTAGMAILGRARWITIRARPPIEQVFAEYGLDAGEFDVLSTLVRSGPPYRLRPTELFRALMISSGGLTDRLRRLTQAGFIRRPAAEQDARSLPVELTPEGRRVAEAAFRKDMAVEARILAALDADEQRDLAALLAKLALSMEDDDV